MGDNAQTHNGDLFGDPKTFQQLQTFDLARRSRSLSVEPNLYVWCQVKRLTISCMWGRHSLEMSMAPFRTPCQMVTSLHSPIFQVSNIWNLWSIEFKRVFEMHVK